jgi:hypothetical protein
MAIVMDHRYRESRYRGVGNRMTTLSVDRSEMHAPSDDGACLRIK